MKILKSIIGLALTGMLCIGCAKTAPAPTDATTAPPTQASTESSAPTTEPTEPPAETTPAPEVDTVSILDLLRIAVEPVGSTMYIWGGGWNEEDTGAGTEAVTLGVSPQWAQFAALQGSDYNYKNHRYQIHDGLDCSGYVGWVVYNVMETTNGRPGYVCSSTDMSRMLADRGLGDYISAEDMDQWLPGDIMSMKGHVWISLGMCDDGSVLLVHASPPGVILCGTTLPDGGDSQAITLAERIMAEHYPDWYSRYPRCDRPFSYLEKSSAMRWSSVMLSDEEGLREMSAEEVAKVLFGE